MCIKDTFFTLDEISAHVRIILQQADNKGIIEKLFSIIWTLMIF